MRRMVLVSLTLGLQKSLGASSSSLLPINPASISKLGPESALSTVKRLTGDS